MGKNQELQRIDAPMDLKSVTLKEASWGMNIAVGEDMDTIYDSYDVKFVLDEQPYLDEIEAEELALQGDKDQLEIDGIDDKKLQKDRVKEVKKKLADAKKEFKDITFSASVIKSNRKGMATELVLALDMDVVDAIDKHKEDLMPSTKDERIYKVILIHGK